MKKIGFSGFCSTPMRRQESSHGRLVLHLGKGKVHLGEPKDRNLGVSGPPRQAWGLALWYVMACLGSILRPSL